MIKQPIFMTKYANYQIDRITKDKEIINEQARNELLKTVYNAIFSYQLEEITLDHAMRIISLPQYELLTIKERREESENK